jgi:arylsulfatase B
MMRARSNERLHRIANALCMVLFLSATGTAHATSSSVDPGKRPNILLIVADDLGWNCVGYHGGPVQTPHIDRLARQGVALERFYVSPLCSPTRAGLMTGLYPMRFGMARSVVRPWISYGLPPQERTLPEFLAEAGYRHRGCFGKWHLGHLAPKWHPLAQGFTQFKGQYNGAADYWTREREGEIDWHVDHAPLQEEGYTTDLIANAAVDFIRQQAKDQPFFCYVPFTAPHTPLQVPEAYLARYACLDKKLDDGKPSELQKLAAMITCMDDGIGRILHALEQTGISQNTLIWFISDNGGVKMFDGVNRPLRGGKLTVYEGGVRVPSVVFWPGVIEGGRKMTEPASKIDVFPTLIQVSRAGTKSVDRLDGIGILDVLTGRISRLPPRDLFCFHGLAGLEREHAAIISADGWKLVVVGPDIRRRNGFRTAKHRVELFHLANDPNEERDLSADHPDRVAELGRKLVAFRASEPAEPMRPENKAPHGWKPPLNWENPPVGAY